MRQGDSRGNSAGRLLFSLKVILPHLLLPLSPQALLVIFVSALPLQVPSNPSIPSSNPANFFFFCSSLPISPFLILCLSNHPDSSFTQLCHLFPFYSTIPSNYDPEVPSNYPFLSFSHTTSSDPLHFLSNHSCNLLTFSQSLHSIIFFSFSSS